MISKKHKATFIHIPKTAGSAIAFVLHKNSFDFAEEPPNDTTHIKNPAKWTKHRRMHELNAYNQNFFCFAFVRNPWDLMTSSYNWWTQNARLKNRKAYGNFLKEKGFSFFIKSNSSYINECFHKNEGQLYWINNKIDFIGKFENLQQDFDTICEKIGIARQELPHENKTNRKHYTEYYDDETREIVAQKYAKDIEYFGYKFGE
jgi:hypothetical protein